MTPSPLTLRTVRAITWPLRRRRALTTFVPSGANTTMLRPRRRAVRRLIRRVTVTASISSCGARVGCATGGRGWSTTGAGTETGSGAGAGGAAPVPVSAIVCDPTLLATVTVAERVPAAEGVNVYDRVHAWAGASVAPHADVSSAKSPALSPASVMPWSVSVPAPLFATVTVLVVVVPPSSRLPASAVDGTLSQAT